MPALRFLADESCDFCVVRALRHEGHDVLAVAEFTNRSDDTELIRQAHRDARILLTEDRDFGWLVFASHEDNPGVLLIRFPGNARKTLANAVLNVVEHHAERLSGHFVVLQPGQVRFSDRR